MPQRKTHAPATRKGARTASPKHVSNGKRAERRAPAPLRDRVRKPKEARAAHDVEYFGEAPAGATHFTLRRLHADGSSERLSIAGKDGVALEHFPLRFLTVEQIRRVWGPGSYRGQWMCVRDRRWSGMGTIRMVQILPMNGAPGPVAGPPRRVVQTVNGFGENAYAPEPVPREPAREREPEEVVDLRVRAEREIATRRLEFEREMFDRRLEVEREEHERRSAALEERLDRLERSRGGDDDEDTGPWDWIAPLAQNLRPTIEQLLPQLLAKLAGGKTLPG